MAKDWAKPLNPQQVLRALRWPADVAPWASKLMQGVRMRAPHQLRYLSLVFAVVLQPMLGCGAAQTQQDRQAATALAAVQQRAVAKQQPVVVLAHADWCAPCNELALRVLDTHDGQALLANTVFLPVNFDDPLGAAVAARLRVLGLPTTLVLRDHEGTLVEFGRIDGYENPADFKQMLLAALERKTPPQQGCHNTDDRPLLASGAEAVVVADAECTAAQLTTVDAGDAADKLRAFLDNPGFGTLGQTWTADSKKRLVEALTLLGRYDARVGRDQARCAADFARLQGWAQTSQAQRGNLVFWEARCLARAGNAPAALQALDRWLSPHQDDAAAQVLVADLLVHERLEPAKAQALLQQATKANPEDHWAFYLTGELAVQRGDGVSAQKAYQRALAIKPGTAIYIKHLQRLNGPETQLERVNTKP